MTVLAYSAVDLDYQLSRHPRYRLVALVTDPSLYGRPLLYRAFLVKP